MGALTAYKFTVMIYHMGLELGKCLCGLLKSAV
jgi:hypothetical protein